MDKDINPLRGRLMLITYNIFMDGEYLRGFPYLEDNCEAFLSGSIPNLIYREKTLRIHKLSKKWHVPTI